MWPPNTLKEFLQVFSTNAKKKEIKRFLIRVIHPCPTSKLIK
jgi:hypothetical protein